MDELEQRNADVAAKQKSQIQNYCVSLYMCRWGFISVDELFSSCFFVAILMAGTTLYKYKPERDIIILDIVRQVAIYQGIIVVTCTTIIYYKTQEQQLKLLEMFGEIDEDFRHFGVEIKRYSFPAKIQTYVIGLVIISLHLAFPYIHFVLDYKLWTFQFLCGSIGLYRGTINFFHLVTIRNRFVMLHEILIKFAKKKQYTFICERGGTRNHSKLHQVCHKHLVL